LSWLAKRRFRMGQTHGRLLASKAPLTKRPIQLALAAAKAGFSLLAGVVCAPFAIKRNRYALRAMLHIGAVSGLIGLREIRQYGELEAISR
jgi:succinoglycan biosynthesis protein ExoM